MPRYDPRRTHPLISRRKNGDELVGYPGQRAADLYAAGTPPMHGLAAKPQPSHRVVDVQIGDELAVVRQDHYWVVRDDQGELGRARWSPTQQGKVHPVTRQPIVFPDRGTLHVERVVLSPAGVVKDLLGYVTPAL